MTQLSHVPWPVATLQRFDVYLGQAKPGAVELSRRLVQVVRRQKSNIASPATERRDVDREDVQTIEQVLAEPSGVDILS